MASAYAGRRDGKGGRWRAQQQQITRAVDIRRLQGARIGGAGGQAFGFHDYRQSGFHGADGLDGGRQAGGGGCSKPAIPCGVIRFAVADRGEIGPGGLSKLSPAGAAATPVGRGMVDDQGVQVVAGQFRQRRMGELRPLKAGERAGAIAVVIDLDRIARLVAGDPFRPHPQDGLAGEAEIGAGDDPQALVVGDLDKPGQPVRSVRRERGGLMGERAPVPGRRPGGPQADDIGADLAGRFHHPRRCETGGSSVRQIEIGDGTGSRPPPFRFHVRLASTGK